MVKKYIYMRKLLSGIFAFWLLTSLTLKAQPQQFHEVGGWLGISNYFGDLNSEYSFSNIRPAGGAFYKYSIGPYIAFKGGLNVGYVAFKDANSDNPFPEVRNLSFRSRIYEASAHVEFNFTKYIPGNKNYFATPYLTLGVSVFNFNPEAEYEGTWYKLRDLGTEGQQNGDFTGMEPYKLSQAAIPIGIGMKYWLRDRWNVGFEINYRFTFTDYLDDVSGTYVNPNILGPASVGAALADRSDEVTTQPIGTENGRQRGDSISNDAYIFMGIFVTHTLYKNNCPKK